MLLCQDYTFKYGRTEFTFRPTHKFNFVCDDSAKGKTWLCKQMLKSTEQIPFTVLTLNITEKFDFTKSYDTVFVIDEVHLLPVMKYLTYKGFQNSPNCFLIFSRNIPAQLSVDYRAVYTLHSKDRKYWLERKYPEYQKFKESAWYYTEDSNSGYKYFKRKLDRVGHLDGKDNILKFGINEDSTFIADGSAFARLLPLVKKIYPTVKLFLPDSFEALLVSYVDTSQSRKIYLGSINDPVLKYKSIEDYFNEFIKVIFQDYSKSKLPEYVYDFDLLNIEHCGITGTIAEGYMINRFNYYECKKLLEQLENKEV